MLTWLVERNDDVDALPSTPSAEGRVNADGSISRTRPATAWSPPHPWMTTGVPECTSTASVVKRSTTTSSTAGSPTSTSFSPAGTTPALF